MTGNRNAILVAAAIMCSGVLAAQRVERDVTAHRAEGCIGGNRCGNDSSIRIRLEDRPVVAISFEAHDDIGTRTDGRVRVRIDDTLIERALDISRKPERHDLVVDGISGRELVIEPASDDEVEIRSVNVRYGSATNMRPVSPHPPRQRDVEPAVDVVRAGISVHWRRAVSRKRITNTRQDGECTDPGDPLRGS